MRGVLVVLIQINKTADKLLLLVLSVPEVAEGDQGKNNDNDQDYHASAQTVTTAAIIDGLGLRRHLIEDAAEADLLSVIVKNSVLTLSEGSDTYF